MSEFKIVAKVVGKHALVMGALAAGATVAVDLVKLYVKN